MQQPFEPKYSEATIGRRLRKTYNKMSYNRFFWWRSYCLKNQPLGSTSSFRDRIINGDFEQGPYLLEVELVHHTMNKKWRENHTVIGNFDHGKYHNETSIDRARKKKLLEDFTKDEASKLADVKRLFIYEFRMTKEDYVKEVDNTSAKDLIDFYYEIEDKYGKKTRFYK